MEFSCPSKAFREAFGVAARVVPSNTTTPVMRSVLVEAGFGSVTFVGQDGQVGIRHRLAGIDVARPGTVLLPKDSAANLLATASGESLRFTLDEAARKLTIRCGSARWTVPTADASIYPNVSEFAAESYHSLSANLLATAIKRTIYAVDPKSERYALGGILVEPAPTQLALVATSGRSLARQIVEAAFVGSLPKASDIQWIIPGRTAKELLALLPDGDANVDLGCPDRSNLHVRFGDTQIVSRLTEGRFPEWRNIFPESLSHRVDVEVAPFRKAVGQASAFRSDLSRRLTFAFTSGQLRLTSEVSDAGESEVDHAVEWPGPNFEIHIDPTYLIDHLKSMDIEFVRLEFGTGSDPFCLCTQDGFHGAIATMNVQEKPK